MNSVAISRDGDTIVSGSYDGKVAFWTRTPHGWDGEFLDGPGRIVKTVEIRNDGKLVRAVDWRENVCFYTSEGGMWNEISADDADWRDEAKVAQVAPLDESEWPRWVR